MKSHAGCRGIEWIGGRSSCKILVNVKAPLKPVSFGGHGIAKINFNESPRFTPGVARRYPESGFGGSLKGALRGLA